MMRSAISPRLAMRTRVNGGVASLRRDIRRPASALRIDGGHSGMLPCFFGGLRVALVREHLERARSAAAASRAAR